MKILATDPVLIPSRYGEIEAFAFSGLPQGVDHAIFAFGKWRANEPINVRIHSECLTGDIFGSQRCDCGPQLNESMQLFAKKSGLIVYLRQEGRGIGFFNKMRAYQLQDQGFDTFEANRRLGFADDLRDFGVAAEMLLAIGVQSVRLYSNNPEKAQQLEANGIRVQRAFTGTFRCDDNSRYLDTKATVGGHDGILPAILRKV